MPTEYGNDIQLYFNGVPVFAVRDRVLLSTSDIKQVIFNNPATIVYFKDGSKVVVKTMDGDEFNEEVGLAMAIVNNPPLKWRACKSLY